MSKPLTIVAKVVAKKDQLDLVKSELLKLVDATLNEEGCINYDLHQDLDDPHIFIFHENWESRETWEQHMESPHLESYLQATDGAIEKLVLNKLTRL